MIRRREFITLLGGAASWPLAARAQQGQRMRRVGVLMAGDENDPEYYKPRLSAFTQALADLGWAEGRNVRMDLRWGGGDINRIRALAQELVGLQPDIILTGGAAATVALQRETRTIPIVFAVGPDPVAIGLVPRLDRPSGNEYIARITAGKAVDEESRFTVSNAQARVTIASPLSMAWNRALAEISTFASSLPAERACNRRCIRHGACCSVDADRERDRGTNILRPHPDRHFSVCDHSESFCAAAVASPAAAAESSARQDHSAA
jgi:putative ABC transport system substrate-binding protein